MSHSEDWYNSNLPARLRIRSLDSRTGSYPTISRTGDKDFRGNYRISFDDTKTVLFTTGALVSAPARLPVNSNQALINGSDIIINAPLVKGVSDQFIALPAGETITPFSEDSHYEQGDACGCDPFYQTGSTIENVGFGFTSPLRSKVKIEIDVEPINPTTFGLIEPRANAPGGVADAKALNARQKMMVYYNFDKKEWETIGKGWDYQNYYWGNIVSRSLANAEAGQQRHSEIYDETPLGFSPSGYVAIFSGSEYSVTSSGAQLQQPEVFSVAGRPMSNFGFPIHQKFHATSSQTFDVSRVINQPLLVEKITYEFSASFNFGSRHDLADARFSGSYGTLEYNGDYTSRILDSGGLAQFTNQQYSVMSSFFILNQRRPFNINQTFVSNFSGPFVDYAVSASAIIPGKYELTSGTIEKPAPKIYVDTSRDLVTYSQLTITSTGSADDENVYPMNRILDSGYARELNLTTINPPGAPKTDEELQTLSGIFTISGTVKQTPRVNQLLQLFDNVVRSASFTPPVAGVRYPNNDLSWIPGGRNSVELLSTGRDLVVSVPGDAPADGFGFYYNNITDNVERFVPGTNIEQASPYLIKPGDRLIFGWQHHLPTLPEQPDVQTVASASSMTLSPGKGKITLYGSFVRGGKEFVDTRNSPLTSNAVHEDIHEILLDQFDTEPRFQFSGSYISDYVTGVMTVQNDTPPDSIQNDGADIFNRGVAAQSIFGDVLVRVNSSWFGETSIQDFFNWVDGQGFREYRFAPGFLRGIRLASESERFFDTLLPSVEGLSNINGAAATNIIYNNREYARLTLGPRIGSDPTLTDNTQARAFPFEPKYSTVPRIITDTQTFTVTDATGNERVLPLALARSKTKFGPSSIVELINPHKWGGLGPSQYQPLNGEDLNIEYFGVGDNTYYTGSSTTYDKKNGDGIFVAGLIRGFKYGIMSTRPIFSRAVVRYDRCGQLRDTLEQRLDSKFYDALGISPDGTKSITGVRSAPVQVKFVEPNTTIQTDPYKTFSSNMSTEATSSLPYFDGVVRNREDPINVNDLNTTVVAL